MIPELDLAGDVHVHSTFSDGASTIAENLRSAQGRGLTTLGLVDHVRRDTTWLPTFVAAVAELPRPEGMRILCGVEAKVLDHAGAVDLPPDLPPLDYVLVADHQVPGPDGPLHPRAVAEDLAAGHTTGPEVVEGIVTATERALGCHAQVVVAHLFSVLPKCGLSEDDVPDALVARLGDVAARAGAAVELNEKWACPEERVARILAGRGVRLTCSSDAHRADAVGRWSSVADRVAALRAPAARR